MKRSKGFLVLIIWILLWISISVFSYDMIMSYLYTWKIYDRWQTMKMDSKNILTSVINSLKTVNVWSSSDRYVKFDQIWNELNKKYYDNEHLNFDDMVEWALKGYVDAIDDPYTVYFTTPENTTFQEDLKGEKDFEWIWAVITRKDWVIMIENVLKWFPAHKAWLRPLDMIIAIEWEKTDGLTVNEAVMKIRWVKWTVVTLSIFRKSSNEVLEIDVTRDKVVIPSVMSKTLTLTWGDLVWYANISIIWEDTARAFDNAMEDFKDQWIKWLIIDLRWNGWWYLPVAVELASHFVDEWKTVVTSKYRIYPPEDLESEWYWTFDDIPIIILVDWYTASASEILSAALRYHVWAKLVWTQTFWKWSIQTIFELNDWSSMKYTVWKWYPPHWENVDWVWLTPDIEIEFDADVYSWSQLDNQLERSKLELFNILSE